ncbi:hypothetical protein J3458_004191 [Metarhizium acridum]|uniref:uncharacterized protein n=1 Tax=Metarhizium acridum TaxID=92637 RepID=UPI001C6B4F26|nr:hypothetical protein J3458_004191 [Metarhizium acridum]
MAATSFWTFGLDIERLAIWGTSSMIPNLDDGTEGGQTDRRLGHCLSRCHIPTFPASAAQLKWTAPWPSAVSGSHWVHFVATGHAQVVNWSVGSCTTAYLAASAPRWPTASALLPRASGRCRLMPGMSVVAAWGAPAWRAIRSQLTIPTT